MPSIILEDLSGNRTLLKWVQKVMVCDLRLANFDPFCVLVWFIACDGNSVIMIEAFELESSRVCEKRSNRVYTKQHKLP